MPRRLRLLAMTVLRTGAWGAARAWGDNERREVPCGKKPLAEREKILRLRVGFAKP